VNVIDTESVYQQAVKLEHFLNEFDVQVGLSVVTDGGRGIPGTKIRGVAESAGFELRKDGRYHRYDESGVELYTLANMEPMPFHLDTLRTLTTRGVTLLLNVPRAPGVPATFRSYIQFARQLAEALDGTIVDDNRQPIGERAIEQVGAQLSAIHEAMAAAGIPAGSPAARRLFAA
ncbi:MAG: cell division protein ZipA C-terminal FtsZ-binding domain-containing protein, partial [Burkholderiales bacterium]|nr:cell division protein ZipA C-terminal FtsZ-binding domain-containing protein [Burkholderiales bacterium]